MRRWGTIFTPILSGLVAALFLWTVSARGEKVCLIKVDGAIGPATANYIARAIDEAADTNAQCLVIQLDTPGGSLDSTRIIVEKFLASPGSHRCLRRSLGSLGGQRGLFHHHGRRRGGNGADDQHRRGPSRRWPGRRARWRWTTR